MVGVKFLVGVTNIKEVDLALPNVELESVALVLLVFERPSVVDLLTLLVVVACESDDGAVNESMIREDEGTIRDIAVDEDMMELLSSARGGRGEREGGRGEGGGGN